MFLINICVQKNYLHNFIIFSKLFDCHKLKLEVLKYFHRLEGEKAQHAFIN